MKNRKQISKIKKDNKTKKAKTKQKVHKKIEKREGGEIKISKKHGVYFVLTTYYYAWSLPWVISHRKKNWLSLSQEITLTNSFEYQSEDLCSLLFLSVSILNGLNLWRLVHAVKISMNACVYQFCCLWKASFFQLPITCSYYNLFDSSLALNLELWGERFNKDIPFRTKWPEVSYSVHCPVVDICINFHVLIKIDLYSNMLLGVILFLCLFLSLNNSSSISPRPKTCVMSMIGHFSYFMFQFHVMEWIFYSKSGWLPSYHLYHYYTSTSFKQVSVVAWWNC